MDLSRQVDYLPRNVSFICFNCFLESNQRIQDGAGVVSRRAGEASEKKSRKNVKKKKHERGKVGDERGRNKLRRMTRDGMFCWQKISK